MARKRYKAEEIVAKLRQLETEHGGCDPPDRRKRSDLLSQWAALPLQDDFDLICLASCKHLSGVTRLIGAPKWGIRSRTPL